MADYCEQPLWIPYRHRGRFPRYYPDVLIKLKDGRQILAEVKSGADLADFSGLRKWRALLRFAHVPGYGVYIGDDETSLARAAVHTIKPDFIEALQIFAGSKSGVTELHMRILRRRFRFDELDLAAAVLQSGLFMTRRPFVIRKPLVEEASVLAELQAAFSGYVIDHSRTFPRKATVPGISRAALGVEAVGGPSWFRRSGWSYEKATSAGCPECGDDLHALRKPWTSPDRKRLRAWAIVCARCATARTMGSLPDPLQRVIRTA